MSSYSNLLDKFTNHVLEAVDRMDRDVVRIEEDIKKYQEALKKSNDDVLNSLNTLKFQIVKVESNILLIEGIEEEIGKQKILLNELFIRANTNSIDIRYLKGELDSFKEDMLRDYKFLSDRFTVIEDVIKKIEKRYLFLLFYCLPNHSH